MTYSDHVQIALFFSLINGKIFREWVSPAMLKAYQWQISAVEINERRELSDLFDTTTEMDDGMSAKTIDKLPEFQIQQKVDIDGSDSRGPFTCPVCLQNFRDEERCRKLPSCNHSFHKLCIDMWLFRHGTCPICRQYVIA